MCGAVECCKHDHAGRSRAVSFDMLCILLAGWRVCNRLVAVVMQVNSEGIFRYASSKWLCRALETMRVSGVRGVAVDVWVGPSCLWLSSLNVELP